MWPLLPDMEDPESDALRGTGRSCKPTETRAVTLGEVTRPAQIWEKGDRVYMLGKLHKNTRFALFSLGAFAQLWPVSSGFTITVSRWWLPGRSPWA